MNRQTGRTTQQLKDCQIGAIYVWPCLGSISHPKRIAKEIGRNDIKIVPLSWLNLENLHGMKLSVVFDHETLNYMNNKQWNTFRNVQKIEEKVKNENQF